MMIWTRLYGWLLGLLPPAVRRADAAEILETFERMLRSTRGRARLRMLAVAFARLPPLLAAEWLAPIARAPIPERKRNGVMDGFDRTLRQSVRGLLRTPSFTLTTVLLLGLGIGGVTTMFTLYDHVLLRPLPYAAAERLVEVQAGSHSGLDFRAFQELRSAEQWAGIWDEDANLTGSGRPERLRLGMVTRDFLAMFGARPQLGRVFVDGDFAAADGVVLSAGLWRRAFGAADDVIGRTITIDGAPHTVIGVLESGFSAPEALTDDIDVWRPLDWSSPELGDRGFHVLSVAARLRPDASIEALQAELDGLATRRAEEHPTDYTFDDGAIAQLPAVPLQEATVGGVRRGLGLLLAAVSLLLLVACTNVAHLFLARGVSRVREMAVRRALGARAGTLAGTLALESLLVGLAGAGLGAGLALVGLRAFIALSPDALPRADGIAVDPRVLLFTAGLGAITALLFGLLPVLRLLRRDVAGTLQGRGRANSDSRRDGRLRTALVVAEVALSLVLVAQAGSLLRSFTRLHAQPLGFRTEGLWTIPLNPTEFASPDEWRRGIEDMRVALERVPGVRAASFGVTTPLQFTGGSSCCWRTRLAIEGRENGSISMMHVVETSYLALFQQEFVAGAPWQRLDEDDTPMPVVITEPLAVEAFGSAGAAIGRPMSARNGTLSMRVAGVVANNRHYGPDRLQGNGTYLPPAAQSSAGSRASLIVDVTDPDDGLAARLREAIWSADPDMPVPMVRPMRDWAAGATARARFEAILFTTFGAVALLLVAGGLYGTLLYTVGRRRRELGIRLALGDAPARLERRVLTGGVITAAFGSAVGLVGAWAFGRFLESRLFGVHASDPLTLAGAAALLLAVAAAASWVPGRRAARTDPMEALRVE